MIHHCCAAGVSVTVTSPVVMVLQHAENMSDLQDLDQVCFTMNTLGES